MKAFECENCGHKPTAKEVLDHHGACAKCGDTVAVYTVDAADYIVSLAEQRKELLEALHRLYQQAAKLTGDPLTDEAMQQARAAITKATTPQP